MRIIQVLCELTTQGGGGRRRPYIARGRGRGRGEAEKRGYGMVARLHVLVVLGGLADGGDVTRISFPELELRPAVRCGAVLTLTCPVLVLVRSVSKRVRKLLGSGTSTPKLPSLPRWPPRKNGSEVLVTKRTVVQWLNGYQGLFRKE